MMRPTLIQITQGQEMVTHLQEVSQDKRDVAMQGAFSEKHFVSYSITQCHEDGFESKIISSLSSLRRALHRNNGFLSCEFYL